MLFFQSNSLFFPELGDEGGEFLCNIVKGNIHSIITHDNSFFFTLDEIESVNDLRM